MRETSASQPFTSRYVRALILGAPKAGKTHFAATAPKPLFISDAAEGGFNTVRSMDPNLWWDPKDPPIAWEIEDAFKDLPPALAKLEALKASGDFPYGTIIIDPISIYADRVLAEMQLRASLNGDKQKDNRGLYGDLANHLRVILLRFHALPCHVLWLCHVKDGGVALAGQTADKLPAYMDFAWLCTNTAALGKPNYEFHTQPYGAFSMLGGRWSVRDEAGIKWGLPSPIIPSFKAVAQVMQLPDKPVSLAMPGFPEGANYTWPPPIVASTENLP